MTEISDDALMAEWLALAGVAVYDGFTNAEEVAANFKIPAVDGTIVAALYGHESYEGSAIVIYVREGKLYESNGSHCSCNGLEDQWSEEETSVAALRKREWPSGLESGTAERMSRLLDMLEAMGKKQ